MAENDALVTRCLNDPDFQEVLFAGLVRATFDKVTEQAPLFTPSGYSNRGALSL